MVTIPRAEYERLKAQVKVPTEALQLARHKRFGASSEKSEETLMQQLSFLFNEAEVFAEAKKEETETVVVAAHKRHKKHEYALDTIPESIPVHTESFDAYIFIFLEILNYLPYTACKY